ncbi:MAG TPA: hypothetical protein VKA35_04705 [Solirubrobacterales bacterium]|nr:hypothetical protein [Solirubrobacterales bacterium]
MKKTLIALVLGSLLAIGAPGCGQNRMASTGPAKDDRDDPPQKVKTYPGDPQGHFGAITYYSGEKKPRIELPRRPPPKKVLIRDLKIGEGPAAKRRDRVSIFYFGVNYSTGKPQYFRWPPQPVLSRQLGGEDWEEALIGMRVGGRRQMIIPSNLLFRAGTVEYIVKMVHLRPASASTSG